jgi:hypothetical protein
VLRPEWTPELLDFLESGVSLLVGTRDARLRPACTRAMGVRADRARPAVTLFVPEVAAPRMLANLDDNGRIAVTVSRPIDHRSIQLKGRCTGHRPAEPGERALQERYLAAYFEALRSVGLPLRLLRRFVWWPSVAVEFEVDSLYEQTPGPSAGRPLAPSA